ncbi:MAG: hypothetical protein A2288_03220 [Candidatus Moranbacteria bacterium RIFOXYA12_FULL_44_15]|nr:MAG: hypothetical protein A2288_03220 [Candidatus Moranbacteria bacterium RIFOXYA12_FULL_44_15]OGI34661.1 MAG: hypothetical protein A2259_01325 [Candidatus Moranbacteria bacterium RIFOXYA2_FULL_43_15]
MYTQNKNFDSWNFLKKKLHKKNKLPYFHEREIWFCHLGVNVGFEQDGQSDQSLRPVIILRKFNSEICIIIPLTKTLKNSIHYFIFSFNGRRSCAILSQMRLIDAKRLKYKTGDIDKVSFLKLKQKLKRLLELE